MERIVAQRTAELSLALATVEAQKRELEDVLRMRDDTQRLLETELEDARLLHGISATLVDENSAGALYQRLVEAATLIMHSDFGSMQRFDPARGELELIAHRGLEDNALGAWTWVCPGQGTPCGKALEMQERVIVPNVDDCDFIAGEDVQAFRRAGVRAAQSTPLFTRNGRLVGMISTHWRQPHVPQERELRLLDIVARQAAVLIERKISADALRQQAGRLLEADRNKNAFLATLAHELRNPLAPIWTGLVLLKSGRPEQAPRIISIVERQLRHMVRLVDDLLDVARISRGAVTLKRSRVALDAIIRSAVETSQPLVDANSHQFSVSVPRYQVWLDVDATRVAQVISNLLNNAAKYTPPGGQIALCARAAADEVAIDVSDTGIGIPPSMRSRIFELFTQVDSAIERSQGGLGVGLALARQLAEMHGGRIDLESPQPGGGSVFTLRLPIAAGGIDASFAAASWQGPATGSAARILVVDDNADAAETLAMMLEQCGHAVTVVLEAPKAVEVALATLPDVVFLDLGMPHLNGFDLARLIRVQPALRATCLVAVSGWGTEEDRRKSRSAGIDHHLTKPVAIDEVSRLLANILAARPH